MSTERISARGLIIVSFIVWAALAWRAEANAGALYLTWKDYATNEQGFKIERKTGASGAYAQIATVGVNVTSYADTMLLDGTTYCYRVRAFNASNHSGYSNEYCQQTKSTAQTFTLTVNTAGSGNGATNPPSGAGTDDTIILEAEAAILSAAMTIRPDAAAAGGKYVEVPEDGGHNDHQERSGYASFAARISRSGTYAFWARTIAPNGTTDSSSTLRGDAQIVLAIMRGKLRHHVDVTGNAISTKEWSVPQSTTWRWNRVGDFSLAAGIANLALRQRADGTKVDQIILSGDPNFVPGTGRSGTSNTGSPLVYPKGAVVKLTATPGADSVFAGWRGNADCSDGSVTMNAHMACTAIFNLKTAAPVATVPGAPDKYTLNISIVKALSSGGTAGGTVTTSPAGVNCGSDCSEAYDNGTMVKLIATPSAGSAFMGWSGGADCGAGSVTMNADITCMATFISDAHTLTVKKSGSGDGKVTAADINCGSDCSASYAGGTAVKLAASPAAGSVFAGWNGAECGGSATCTVVVGAPTSITANFHSQADPSKIGVFRPGTGEFFLDRNGNGQWDGCEFDTCLKWFESKGAIPVAGNWDGTMTSRVGVFDSDTGRWYLDRNGNGEWDGCELDRCATFGGGGDFPVVRYPSASDKADIGIFRSKVVTKVDGVNTLTDRGIWRFDDNGNHAYNGCQVDRCFAKFGYPGDVAVVGDWDGSGTDQIGIFRAKSGRWLIDFNGNGIWEGCNVDKCLLTFGQKHDLPVTGDWDGTGKTRIGVFRPSTGEWFLDANGNGGFDGCETDVCISSFGQPGDLPLVGRW